MAALAESPRKVVPRFRTLDNITPDATNALFKASKDPFSIHPVLVIAVGSPGVGKTSLLKKILNNEPLLKKRGITYDHFYNVSLDTLVEHVQPYRNLTRKVHNEYKNAKKILHLRNNPTNEYYNYELSNSDYGNFSTMYLQMIRSEQPNFSLGAEEVRLRGKLQLPEIVVPRKNIITPKKRKPIKQGQPETPKKHKEQECHPSCRTTDKHNKHNGGSLKTVMDNAIERAIQSGFNIIYDTTFGGNTNKVDGIMDILIKHPMHKYTIFIIHITASESEIVERIKRRHLYMINHNRPEKNRYLRAIRPTLTRKYISDNKLGFYNVYKKYTNPAENIFKNKIYSPKNFIFKAFINPEGKNPEINHELISMLPHNQLA